MYRLKMVVTGAMALALAGCGGVEIPDLRGGFGNRTDTQQEDLVERVADVEVAIPDAGEITETTLGEPLVNNVVDRGPCIIGGDNSGRPHCP